jgi:hypothetical protein
MGFPECHEYFLSWSILVCGGDILILTLDTVTLYRVHGYISSLQAKIGVHRRTEPNDETEDLGGEVSD